MYKQKYGETYKLLDAQIYQNKKGKITFKIVKNLEYSESDERKLLLETKERLGDIEIAIEYVDSINKTSSGKFRFVISELESENKING